MCEKISAASTVTVANTIKCDADGSQVASPVLIEVTASSAASNSIDTEIGQSAMTATSDFKNKNGAVTKVTTKDWIQFDSGSHWDRDKNTDIANQSLAKANLWDSNICVFMKPKRGVSFEKNKTKFKLENLEPKTSDELEQAANRLGVNFKNLEPI